MEICNNKDCIKNANKKCKNCKKAFYCSKNCQYLNWPNHKRYCRTDMEIEELKKKDKKYDKVLVSWTSCRESYSDFDYSGNMIRNMIFNDNFVYALDSILKINNDVSILDFSLPRRGYPDGLYCFNKNNLKIIEFRNREFYKNPSKCMFLKKEYIKETFNEKNVNFESFIIKIAKNIENICRDLSDKFPEYYIKNIGFIECMYEPYNTFLLYFNVLICKDDLGYKKGLDKIPLKFS